MPQAIPLLRSGLRVFTLRGILRCLRPGVMASLRPHVSARLLLDCLRIRSIGALISVLLAVACGANDGLALGSLDAGLMCPDDEAAAAAPMSVEPLAPVCITACGDALLSDDEACDDGNFRNNDGCAENCSVEAGFECAGEPSDCRSICGNGALDYAEGCDDGDLVQADGCSPDCRIERGWICSGAPSVCVAHCGDGAVIGTEQCDDGAANGTAEGCCTERCMFRAAGSDCDDQQPCTAGDACNASGRCRSSGPVDCSDGDACTNDVCNPQKGCQYTFRPPPCHDAASDGVVRKRSNSEPVPDRTIAIPNRASRSVVN
jgi:cysteine-rich repeat protein